MVTVKARMQRKRGRSYILANHFHDLNSVLDGMPIQSRDFKSALGIVGRRMTRRLHGSVRHGHHFVDLGRRGDVDARFALGFFLAVLLGAAASVGSLGRRSKTRASTRASPPSRCCAS